MKKIQILLISLFATLNLAGEHPSKLKQSSDHLGIIGQHGTEGIMLRWAPKSFSVWQIASTTGYVLERAEWDESQWPFVPNNLEYKQFGRFRALPRNDWQTKANINDPLVAVAAQSLFGNEATKGMPSGTLADLRLMADLQENRHAIAMFAADLSADAAAALGLFFYDKDVVAGRDYVYRLRTNGNKEGFGIDTVWLYMPYDGIPTPKHSVQNITTSSSHGRVDILWDKPLNARFFTAFYVERSIDNKTYQRVNELPITTALGDDQPDTHIYSDYDVQIGKQYYYRLIGITPFAETSDPGESIIGIAKDLEGPVPPQNIEVEQKEDKFVLTWDMGKQTISSDAVGWYVKRSTTAAGQMQKLHDQILPLRQRSFTDNNPVPVLTNYYRVYAVDTAGNETPSIIRAAIWVDSIPPATPTGLNAMVDSTGIVSIFWNNNSEPDLQGYRVFARDDRNKEWYQLTSRPIVENIFSDTIDLKSLSRSIQYTVISTDFNYNTSAYAPEFTLKMPDLVAPSAPRWASWNVEENQIKLSWYPSAATDLRGHRLFQSDDQGRLSLCKDYKIGENSTIADVAKGVPTSFALIAIDSAGNVSDTVYLRNIRNTYVEKLPAIRQFKAKVLADEKAILVEWQYDAEPEVSFVLYRKSIDSDQTELVARLQSATRIYTDRGPTSFREGFDYYLKAVAHDGRESALAMPVRMRF